VQFLMDFLHDLEHALPELDGQVRGHLAADFGHEGVGGDLIVAAVGVVLVLDVDVLAEHFPDHAEEIAHLHGLIAREHDVLVGVFRPEDFHGAQGGVLDVDVFAQGRGRAVIGDLALFERFGHEAVDGVAAVGAGPVEGAVAQDRVFEAEHGVIIFDVQLARLLAATVEAARFAVDVEGAGEDVALDPGLAAGFEQDDVAEDVDAGGFNGLLVGFPDVRKAREIEDGVRAADHGVDHVLVEHAPGDHFLIGAQIGRRTQIDDGHVVARVGKLVANVRSQKAGTAEKDDFHSGTILRFAPLQGRRPCGGAGPFPGPSVRGRRSRAAEKRRRCRRR